jgi:REP element-mobilizing transposase RayT
MTRRIWKRRSLRCRTWNYSSKGWYFITILTHKHTPLFGYIANGEMTLNALGHIVMQEWESSKALRPHMHFDTIMVMPDHVHMLVCIKHQMYFVPRSLIGRRLYRLPRSISSFVAQFKATCVRTTRHRLHYDAPIWQRDYDNQCPRTPTHVNAVRRYIRNNPRNANNTPIPHLLHYNTSRHVNTP